MSNAIKKDRERAKAEKRRRKQAAKRQAAAPRPDRGTPHHAS